MKSLIKVLLLALLSAGLLSACGGGGSGTAPSPSLSVATSLSFAAQTVGVPSIQVLTVTNTGTGALLISGITLTGAAFTQTNNCTSVAPAATCAVTVTYTPSAAAQTGSLNIASNAPNSPAIVTLNGAAGLTNFLPVTASVGPLAGLNYSVNVLYATITVCTPGSTTACTTIPNIQVDTGSVGLRLISPLGTAVPTPITDSTTTSPIFECVQFVDGYTWGSMVTLDVQFGGQTLSNVAVNLLGDAAAGAAPADCATAPTNIIAPTYMNESTVVALGVNGILGVGNLLQDCEVGCTPAFLTSNPQYLPESPYYVCPAGNCVHTGVALANQANNLAALLNAYNNVSADHNGIMIDLPAAPNTGLSSLEGKLFFGINNQNNNQLPASAKTYSLSYSETLSTTYKSSVLPYSFIDSGSNGLFFDDPLIPTCADLADQFFCPSNPDTLSLSAVIQSSDATVTSGDIAFTIGNADTLLPSLYDPSTALAVQPTLGGPLGLTGSFDWGLQFFYGRRVFVLFDNYPGYGNGAIAFE